MKVKMIKTEELNGEPTNAEVEAMRITDDNGRSPHRPEGARPVTGDGRLLWVGPLLPHQQHEFFLDGVNLGSVTLEQAMRHYAQSQR